MVVPAVFHTEKKKPLLDEEGRALQALEQVHLNDVTGPLADKALFLAGGVKFYREDYSEADHYFSMLVEQHKDSPLAPQAIELAIISKHMSTGGPDYDGRKVAEARLLVDSALRNYPELARDKSGFLERQLGSISYQQAQKDYLTAEFYRRTGHPGSAYFYYEIVRRRYPGSKFADLATERMNEIRRQVEETGGKPATIFDQAKASVDRMFGKKPAEGGVGRRRRRRRCCRRRGPDPGHAAVAAGRPRQAGLKVRAHDRCPPIRRTGRPAGRPRPLPGASPAGISPSSATPPGRTTTPASRPSTCRSSSARSCWTRPGGKSRLT